MAYFKDNSHPDNVNTGEMNKLIAIGTIEEIIEGGLPVGEDFVPTYPKLWAKVAGISKKNQEYLMSQGLSMGEIKQFTIRYKPNITNKLVIKYKNKIYNVYAVYPLDEKEEFLLLTGIIYV